MSKTRATLIELSSELGKQASVLKHFLADLSHKIGSIAPAMPDDPTMRSEPYSIMPQCLRELGAPGDVACSCGCADTSP
jgi:hypothetical protein